MSEAFIPTPAIPTAPAGIFSALANPSFRRLWIAGWLWYVSRWMEMIVLSWLVLELTDSPSQVALVGVSRMAPMFLLGLVAGSIADRFPKKRVLLASQTVNLLVSSIMMLVLIAGVVQPWHAFVVIFLTGVAWAVDFSARRAYFAEIFAAGRVNNAISLDIASLTGSSFIGPLLGGGFIAVIGFAGAYGVMVGLYLVGFVLLLSIRGAGISAAPVSNKSVATQTMEAVRLARANRTIWAALMVTVALNFFGFPYMQMVPVIARDVLGAGEMLYGVLSSAAGVGSLIGALLIASRNVRRQGTVYSLGATLMLAAVFLFALSNLYPLSLLFLFLAGIGMSGFAIMQTAIVLQAAPPEMRGRAMGVVALGIGASPIGILIVGQLAEALDPQLALQIWAGIGVIVITALRWWLPELRNLPGQREAERQDSPLADDVALSTPRSE